MAGTILNMLTVLVGGLLGLVIGNRLPSKMQESVVTGLGFVTLLVGFQNAQKTGNPIIPLLATVIGVMIGEWLTLDVRLQQLGAWLQQRFNAAQNQPTSETGLNTRERFITGYITASLVFCIGPLTFVGSIQDGMGLASGFQFLAIKSVLDGFAALAFAASFGVGVLFSLLTILVIQGGLALVGSLLIQGSSTALDLSATPAINEMTAAGGLLLIGIALTLLDIKKPRMANFLPALLIAPLLVAIAGILQIDLYPF